MKINQTVFHFLQKKNEKRLGLWNEKVHNCLLHYILHYSFMNDDEKRPKPSGGTVKKVGWPHGLMLKTLIKSLLEKIF